MIERIRGPLTKFTIRQDGYYDLLLEVENVDELYRFYMEYSANIASGINHEVEYTNGMIMFTDFDLIIGITEYDYTVPIVEDLEECPVCYETYEPMYGSLCGHHTCLECMRKMDAQGLSTCPLCRSDNFKYPIAVACNRMFVRS